MGKQMKTPGASGTATGGKLKATKPRQEHSPKQLTRQQKWRQRNPAAYLAHLTVQNAVRLGVLKPEPCEVCGAEKVEAHHPDYSQPLLVQWRCVRHHRELHRRGA